MIDLRMISTREDLISETGMTADELWDAGFDLDDWDVCFVSNKRLIETYEEKGETWHDTWEEPIEDAYWLITRMDSYCVGYREVKFCGKWYYMVYHA